MTSTAGFLDPRLNAFRPDLADCRLRDRVEAERYAEGEAARVAAGIVPLCRTPGGSLDTQLLFGEAVEIFEVKGGWAWVQAQADRYVGYVPAESLARGQPGPTHRVSALVTFRFSAASIKSPPLDHLSLGAPLLIAGEQDRFLELADGGFVYAPHAEPIEVRHGDWVSTAERFLELPYLWGGRSALGLDCSALVQTSLRLAGFTCPRDTYQQVDSPALGAVLPPDTPLRRGDLVFSPGHVAIASGAETLVHANAFHLAVAHEPLAGFRYRLAHRGEAITRIRRPNL